MAYAAKLERNSVRIVNTTSGSTVRTIGGTFTGAIVQGEEAHLTQANGRIRVVNIRTGSTIRTI
jgi:broad specificity phosphatase PhoE